MCPIGRITLSRTESNVIAKITTVCTATPHSARRHKAAVRVSIYAASSTMASAPVTVPPLRNASVVTCIGHPAAVRSSSLAQPLRIACETEARRAAQQRGQPRRGGQWPAGGIVRRHSGHRRADL